MNSTVKLYAFDYRELRTYLATALFVIGNIVLPQLCHLIPQGGFMLLPIYFFTLIAAYKYGRSVGLLAAVLSPVVNSMLFGMPAVAVLPSILVKSVLLALIASAVARRTQTVSLLWLAVAVLAYQVAGSLIESLWLGDFATGFQDFTIGLPGMALQVVGGYLVIKHLLKH